jgi:hypothetical protein
MDMRPAFIRAAKDVIPFAESKIVHEGFHIMKMTNDSVDKVHRGKHQRLIKDRDDLPKVCKYFWLTSLENSSEEQHTEFRSINERINRKIRSMNRRVGGYRNIENFKAAVLFYCGGLNLDPRQCRMVHFCG